MKKKPKERVVTETRGGRKRSESQSQSEDRRSERGFAHSNHNAQGRSAAQPKKYATMGMVSFPKVVVPSLLGSFVLSYAFWDLSRNRKIFGGTVPHTIKTNEWEKETEKRLNAWPREAAGPVVMNPISRQNYNKA